MESTPETGYLHLYYALHIADRPPVLCVAFSLALLIVLAPISVLSYDSDSHV